jgi:hypothetical protein
MYQGVMSLQCNKSHNLAILTPLLGSLEMYTTIYNLCYERERMSPTPPKSMP